ncbi:FitA-like ribbon-helix-helix domain-containing protein [Granulicoccus sp. GXG6511]|uniref:FitA-like ribbon-helix-helix domain-containing protein n=1 Tax=Granulicoccus sp. GXG6511 TaxID=3381351 RepID=UPI003D7CC1BC
MTAITIRKLPLEVKQRLRLRAAANGRSMEAEARSILIAALDQTQRADLSWIEQLIQVGDEVGGVELAIPEDDDATVADLRGI